MKCLHGEYEIDDDRERIDFTRVHAWLSNTYWSRDIPRENVERAAQHSALTVGAYDKTGQVGFLRVVSDATTFAWVCDVFVEETHRGQGLARAMVQFALNHPDYQGLRRWMLATQDAHGVYAACGFRAIENPDRLMIFRPLSS